MLYMYGFGSLLSGLFIVNFIFSYQSKHIDPAFWSTFKFQLIMLPLFLTANLLIGYGIKFGQKAIEGLSFVLISSKSLELFISIFMGYFFLRELPTWKTLLGLSIIIFGVVVTKLNDNQFVVLSGKDRKWTRLFWTSGLFGLSFSIKTILFSQ